MEGKRSSRRPVPPVVRSFAPTRLTAELLASVYERLLAASPANGSTGAGSTGHRVSDVCLDEDDALSTGGRR
jgi:hypothetical protein